MGKIPRDLIDQIRIKSDIVETISSYVPLNKKGKNFMGICPFHDDSNPSMSVNPERQIFKCFVCGEGGNVFTFIEKYEKTNFVDAVLKQAHNVNIDMSQYETTTITPVNQRKEALISLMAEVKNFTSYQLKSKDGMFAYNILRDRGYTDEVIELFGIGVALSGNQIFEFLKAKGYSEEQMLSVDIIRVGTQDIQDVFYNRLMFPIRDQYGNVIAFSARTVDPNSTVKYINTGETELYTKSNHVYNLDHVKNKYKYAEQIIITEGVTDVFAFTMAGFDNVVSLLGVACSDTQVQLIKRTGKSVLLAFDGDKAGIDATYAIGLKLRNAKIPISIWYNDSGLDPDDLFKSKGKEAIAEGINEALGWFDFLLSYSIGIYGLESFENRKRVISFFLPNIELEDSITQQHYLKQLSHKTDFDVDTLQSQLKTHRNPVSTQPTQLPIIENYNQYILTSNVSRAELEILNQMILSKEAALIFSNSLGFLPNDLAHSTALMIRNVYRTQDTLQLADILSSELSDELRRFILELEERLTFNNYDESIVLENIDRIKLKLSESESTSMIRKLKSASNIVDQSKIFDDILTRKKKL